MKVNVEYEYLSQYLPPRCKKLREKLIRCDMDVKILEVSHEDAPMVMAFIAFGQQVTIVRAYKGKLYWSYQVRGYRKNDVAKPIWVNAKADSFPWHHFLSASIYKWVPIGDVSTMGKKPVIATQMEVKREIRKKANSFIIVDGLVYSLESEPVYTIETFGVCDSLGLSIGKVDSIHYPDFHYSALEREACHEDIQLRLVFYRKKVDPMKTCYIKVWDKSWVKFKHEETL